MMLWKFSGICECPPYYEGETCEELICVNNGTRIELANKSYACKCAYPEHISGKHCELVRCDNNGQPQKDGHCRCLDYWYTGQFCESYTASWGAVVGVPLVCITVIVICCIVCRLDFCPRRKIRQSRRRRPGEVTDTGFTRPSRWARNFEDQMQQRRILEQRNYDSAIRLQENYWNEDMSMSRSGDRADLNPAACPIRLDTIPVFNPRMIGGVPERNIKLIEPPPPYEQVISSNYSQQHQSPDRNSALSRPPGYTSTVSAQPGPTS
uniref:EGF-like domain-containing protein n=1 Tax=Syphacia muris TaxID=451379 RepID=A0A0N5ANI8_9BILA